MRYLASHEFRREVGIDTIVSCWSLNQKIAVPYHLKRGGLQISYTLKLWKGSIWKNDCEIDWGLRGH